MTKWITKKEPRSYPYRERQKSAIQKGVFSQWYNGRYHYVKLPHQIPEGEPVTPAPTYLEDEFYAFGTGSDDTVRKAKMNGTVIWSRNHPGTDEADASVDSNPKGELLVGDTNGNVTKYDKDGNQLWSYGTNNNNMIVWFASDGDVMAVGEHVYFYSLDSDGNLQNSVDLTQITGYSSINDYHVRNAVITENKNLFFYNGNENDLVRVPFDLSGGFVHSVFSGNVLQGVICGDDESYLYAAAYGNFGKMDRQGNVIWTNGLNGQVTACCYYNEHIYVAGEGQIVYVVDKSGNVADTISGDPLPDRRIINMVVSQRGELYLAYDDRFNVRQIDLNNDGTLGSISTATGIPGADVITKGGHFLPFKESL